MQDSPNQDVVAFWRWFQDAVVGCENVQDPKFVREIDDRVARLNPKLSWEIGPGFSETWRLVISPNLDQELRDTARKIIAQAPVLPGWEFYSTRQPKEWNYKIELTSDKGDPIRVNASNWTFVLLRYPDATYEVLLKGQQLSSLNDAERWQAAAIALESILGEELVMDRIDEFELVEVLEPEFAKKERPIQELRNAIRGTI